MINNNTRDKEIKKQTPAQVRAHVMGFFYEPGLLHGGFEFVDRSA
jgi:hypothetical protein